MASLVYNIPAFGSTFSQLQFSHHKVCYVVVELRDGERMNQPCTLLYYTRGPLATAIYYLSVRELYTIHT